MNQTHHLRGRTTMCLTGGACCLVWLLGCNVEERDRDNANASIAEDRIVPPVADRDPCAVSDGGIDAVAGCSVSPPADSGPLYGQVYSSSALQLFWPQHANDDFVSFDVFRDGSHVGSTIGTSWFDQGLLAATSYDYDVVPVGVDGAAGAAWSVSFTTLGNFESVGAIVTDERTDEPAVDGTGIPDDTTTSSSGSDSASAGDASSSTSASSSSGTSPGPSGSSAGSDTSLDGRVSATAHDGTLLLRWEASVDGRRVTLFDLIDGRGVLLVRTDATEWSTVAPAGRLSVIVHAVVDGRRLRIGSSVTVVDGLLID